MDQLLQHAVDSIRLGVEDYRSKDPARPLSAVRNLHSGVLLLFKEKLRRLSPPGSADALVKRKLVPETQNGKVCFVGVGTQTANWEQIKERFEGLGVSTDWNLYRRFAEVRNDVEHYIPKASDAAIRGHISAAYVLIRDFVSHELQESPADLLGQETWDTMLGVQAVMQRERDECVQILDSVDWGSRVLAASVRDLRCTGCGSPLLVPIPAALTSIPDLSCRQCGAREAREEYAERAVHELLSYESGMSAMDGGDVLFVRCPHCGREAYVLEEQQCAACCETCVHVCARCETKIPAEELSDGSLCGYCAHVSSKD